MADKLALVAAAILILGGFFALLHPQTFVIEHSTFRGPGRGTRPIAIPELVTPLHARLYGLASVVVGTGLTGFIVWASRAR